MLEIKHWDDGKKGEFYLGNSHHHLAEMTYTWAGDSILIIDHTLVDETLRGQGVGHQLLNDVVQLAREKQVKIIPFCPVAKSVFDRDLTLHDLLK